MAFVAKQDITNIPLHVVYEKVLEAVTAVQHDKIFLEQQNHDRMIARKEAEWNSTHEAPFEGNFSELYPFVLPNPEALLEAANAAKKAAIKESIEYLGLKAKASWFLPQMTAYIAKMKLPRNSEGKIDGNLFKDEFAVDSWHRGLFIVATCFQRGLIIGTQTNGDNKSYCALVPLLMMPFKKFNGIQYSEWDRESIKAVLDENLAEAMLCESYPELSNEEILSIRDRGLQVHTGTKQGEIRNPLTYHNLYKIQDTPIGELPWLAQVMYTQIWCAHPVNRNAYMILDYKNWDNTPEPLIQKEIVVPKIVPKNLILTAW